ncbi:hypothetical protein BDR03DRAFT_1013012 [Suillus americanus]|nr:hypothetical protein BDR03DRAFT_1013012 [Suillus americanus]
MEQARPAKWVYFQEAPCNLINTPALLPSSKSNQMLSPSEEDICKWTNTNKATAPCFIRDMRESGRKACSSSFYWLGHIPCQAMLIVGVVVGIEVSERWALYTGESKFCPSVVTQPGRKVDDSTAVIECMLRHPLPYAHLAGEALTGAMMIKLHKCLLPPPPPPVTTIGYMVEVIKPCDLTNNQWKHAIAIVELHKSKYIVPKPFEIPTEMHPAKFASLKLPKPSSPLMHSVTSGPSSFVICGSTDPPIFRHPSQLQPEELTDKTFQLYLQHYLDHAPAQAFHWDFAAQLSRAPEVQTLLECMPPSPPPLQDLRSPTYAGSLTSHS